MPDISQETKQQARDWINATPRATLLQVVKSNKWVFNYAGNKSLYNGDIDALSDEDLREAMEDQLYEDYAYVEEALQNVGIPVVFDPD